MLERAVSIVLVIAWVGCKREQPAASNAPGGAGSATANDPLPPVPDASVKAPPPKTAAQRIEVAFKKGTIAIDAQVPVGWTRMDGLASWYPPGDEESALRPRHLTILAACDGGCTPAALEKQLPAYLDKRIELHRHPDMPDPTLRAEAPVKVLERGALAQGGEFVLVRVEPPPGLKAEAVQNYANVFAATCATRRAADGFMVITHVSAAPADETTWWPVLVAACKATRIASP